MPNLRCLSCFTKYFLNYLCNLTICSMCECSDCNWRGCWWTQSLQLDWQVWQGLGIHGASNWIGTVAHRTCLPGCQQVWGEECDFFSSLRGVRGGSASNSLANFKLSRWHSRTQVQAEISGREGAHGKMHKCGVPLKWVCVCLLMSIRLDQPVSRTPVEQVRGFKIQAEVLDRELCYFRDTWAYEHACEPREWEGVWVFSLVNSSTHQIERRKGIWLFVLTF